MNQILPVVWDREFHTPGTLLISGKGKLVLDLLTTKPRQQTTIWYMKCTYIKLAYARI